MDLNTGDRKSRENIFPLKNNDNPSTQKELAEMIQ